MEFSDTTFFGAPVETWRGKNAGGEGEGTSKHGVYYNKIKYDQMAV